MSYSAVFWMLMFVAGLSFMLGAGFMLHGMKKEVQSGVVTFSGEAWETRKVLPK